MNELTTEMKRAALAKKIEEVAVSLLDMEKDGTNKFSKYSYISADNMNKKLRVLFKEKKISIFPSVIGVSEKEFTGTNREGKETLTIRTTVEMDFQIIDHETGHQEVKKFFGAEQDTGGKSMQQAITQCTKYFYFKLFRVSDSKEIDGDSKTTTTAKAPRSAPTTPPNGNLGKCGKCGAQNRLSKAGKVYCGDTCWKKEEYNGADEGDDHYSY